MKLDEYLMPLTLAAVVLAFLWVGYTDVKLRSQDYQTCLSLHAASVNDGKTPPFCVRGE